LGDVVHAMPAVQDIRSALPDAQIDWVVEPGFAPLVRRCSGVRRVIECPLRQWRKAPFSAATRLGWRAFRADLRATTYDAVIDLQGLTKSALVARLAKLSATGKRFALANRTDGSGYEAPTRWLADVAVAVTQHSHAVLRSRELCAKALGYAFDPHLSGANQFGLLCGASATNLALNMEANDLMPKGAVALVHGTSRADKLWAESDWIALAARLLDGGWGVALPHGNEEELARSQRIAQALRASGREGATVQVLPRLGLDALTDEIGRTRGVIGLDSGLSHIAVALDLPHVQIYNFDTAWRTGPSSASGRQCSVYASPQPTLDKVWAAWLSVNSGRNALWAAKA
jgi:heptosyltransferase-1